jgi:hypothetical protein
MDEVEAKVSRAGSKPESFIIDKNGIIVKKVLDPLDWAKPNISRFFEDLLQTSRS